MKKAPRTFRPGTPSHPSRLTHLCAVEDVRADLLDLAQALAPRRRHIGRVIPQDVWVEARYDIGRSELGDRFRSLPRERSRVRVGKLTVTNERELRGLLDHAAPVGRVAARGGAVH